MMRKLFLCFSLLALAACSGDGVEHTYKDPGKESMYKHGSLLGDEGGFSILGGRDKDDDGGSSGLGVNAFLWRASLDTLSFMPIAQADPFGGVILTDWYSPADAPNERFKVNVYILDRKLRSDGVRASVFRQQRDFQGGWRDADVEPTTARELEDSILTRARQLRVSQEKTGG